MSAFSFSVIIPTFGRPALASAAALSALAQALPGVDFEVIVVDDGGQDGTEKALAALGDPRLRYHRIEHAGPAAARNAGAKLAQGAILAFLDSDTLAQPGWLLAAELALAADPTLFGVEGRVLPMVDRQATPFTEAVQNLHGQRWLTCNLFVRRQDFLELGGFDERFTEPCREDSEFAFRAMEAGLRFAFVPEALVLHPVREVPASRYYHHALEGRFEALIERQHPQSYLRYFKRLDGRQLPLYYAAHFAALAGLLLRPAWALPLLGLGVGALLYAWCRGKKSGPADWLRLLPPALVVPYLRAAAVLLGYWRYEREPKRTALK